jgi:hypothetical protein
MVKWAVGAVAGGGAYRRKLTVEECLVLDVDALNSAGLLDHERARIECRVGGTTSTFAYSIKTTNAPDCLYLYLFYPDGHGHMKQQWITLLSKPQHFGGVRWHFFCPQSCGRWVRKLYFSGDGYFGCRTCLDLTYRSAQEHDRRIDSLRHSPRALRGAIREGSFWAIESEERQLSRRGDNTDGVVITGIDS